MLTLRGNGCCACNSADNLQQCTVSAGCPQTSNEFFLSSPNIGCEKISAPGVVCPTFYEPELVGGNLSVSIIEAFGADCCSALIPGQECGNPDGCAIPGFYSQTITSIASGNTIGPNSIIASGSTTYVTSSSCGDGEQSSSSEPFSYALFLPEFGICCATQPGICTNSTVSLKRKAWNIVGYSQSSAAGTFSRLGDCLSSEGATEPCQDYPCPICATAEPEPVSPSLSGSITMTFINRQNETIFVDTPSLTTQICGIRGYNQWICANCCGPGFGGSWAYSFNISANFILKFGNE